MKHGSNSPEQTSPAFVPRPPFGQARKVQIVNLERSSAGPDWPGGGATGPLIESLHAFSRLSLPV